MNANLKVLLWAEKKALEGVSYLCFALRKALSSLRFSCEITPR